MAGTQRDVQRANMQALQQASRNISLVLQAGEHAVRPALADTGIEIVNEVRQSMASTRRDSSRMYRRGRKIHVASAPGSPPAPDTGRLTSSYGFRLSRGAKQWHLDVGTNVAYAAHLEFGTSVMEARPHLRPAIAKTATRIGAVLAARMAKEQRSTARRLGSAARLPRLS